MVTVFQLKRQIQAFGAECSKTKGTITPPGETAQRYIFFAHEGKIAATSCTSENDELSWAEVDRILRTLGLFDVFGGGGFQN